MSNFEVDFNIYKIDGTDGYKLLFDSDGLTIDSGFYVDRSSLSASPVTRTMAM